MLTDNDGNVAAAAELTAELTVALAPWQDTSRTPDERVADLIDRMTLEEKLAQLYALWLGITGGDGGHSADGAHGADGGHSAHVAPFQHDFADPALDWRRLVEYGLGQLTRPLGTAPVDAAAGAAYLADVQAQIVAANRFGIPALVHEECLTGLMAWGATCYPTPLAWGAAFHPDLVERMAAQIGSTMRDLGVHQGLSPVLDVTRDPRWGRTEETIGEDPYLVATIGTAYVRGLQSAGVIATLKHFAGYSASRGGRNFAPVAIGRRELADVLLPPFEMAVRDGGAGSVMPSYAEIDGLPVAADGELLTGLLRGVWGFTGTVVADYFEVSFLQLQHGVVAGLDGAAATALAAGVDVELPSVRCYGEPLRDAVRSGAVPEALVDRAVRRVLGQKCQLGLLEPDWSPPAPVLPVELDPAPARALARELAEQSIILLANDGVLPLPARASVAVVGPLAHDRYGMLGCYTFPSHVGRSHPGVPIGVEIVPVLDALHAELPDAAIGYAPGCSIDGDDTSGIAKAVETARRAEVCVAVLGDRSGMFGLGTSGEGCDVADLRLPGVQAELLDALVATGVPVVAVLLTGRPYALGAVVDRLAAVVQAFFPGEEGGGAVAGVLSGRVCPSGRLPVGVPRNPGGQPAPYLAPLLGHVTEASSVDPTPLFPFGHGLSYTEFEWDDPRVDPAEIATDGALTLSLTVRNVGTREGTDVVQLYLHDPVAQVTRPVVRLIGYARVPLRPGQARTVSFEVHADLTAFTGRAGHRLVEPGEVQLRLSRSSVDVRHTVPVRLVGDERVVDHRRRLTTVVTVQ